MRIERILAPVKKLKPSTVALGALCVVLVGVGAVGRHRQINDPSIGQGSRPVPSIASGSTPTHEVTGLRVAVRSGIEDLRKRESADDARFFAGGVWHTGHRRCLRCDVGPGVAAAALGKLEDDPRLIRLAIRTMDSVVRRHRLPSGAVNLVNPAEADIQTSLFAAHLGMTLHILGDDLDDSYRQRWTEALRGATEFLIHNGNYEWYTNGNIVLANALVAGLTWKVTGDTRYEAVYRRAMAFAERPSAERWPGRGLVLTKHSSKPDGSDGAGYLTEGKARGRIGFDADYAQVQADFAAMIAMVTGDPAALRLTNLLVNQLLPRVNRTTWLLDTSGGTRLSAARRTVPFTTSALGVLAGRGRPDLVTLVPAQTEAIGRYIPADRSEGSYQLWGSRLAPLLLSLS